MHASRGSSVELQPATSARGAAAGVAVVVDNVSPPSSLFVCSQPAPRGTIGRRKRRRRRRGRRKARLETSLSIHPCQTSPRWNPSICQAQPLLAPMQFAFSSEVIVYKRVAAGLSTVAGCCPRHRPSVTQSQGPCRPQATAEGERRGRRRRGGTRAFRFRLFPPSLEGNKGPLRRRRRRGVTTTTA